MREKLYKLLEETGTPLARWFDAAICLLILASVFAIVLETVEPINVEYAQALWLFEIISVAIFTVEYLTRLWVCVENPLLQRASPAVARARYAISPFPVIDLLAILPFYLSFFLPMDMRILRIFRLFRILKIARYSPALSTIAKVFIAERRALLGALVIMFGLLLISSTFVYYAEHKVQPEKFGNIPEAMWWALATLTTVGYGDVVPITLIGRIIGGFVMIFGLGVFALPIGIVATGFADEIHRRDFVVSWSMVAKVPLFTELPLENMVEIARLLHAKKEPEDVVLARPGDYASCMYFVIEGEVELQFSESGETIIIKDGDYFGEIALLRNTTRKAKITTKTSCRLLILEAADFHRLMITNAGLREHIQRTAEQREMQLREINREE